MILWLLCIFFLEAAPNIYITQSEPGLVGAFSARTHLPSVGFFVPPGARQIAISPDGNRLYVCSYKAGCFTVIDIKSTIQIAKIDVPNPKGIAIDKQGQWGFVVSGSDLLRFDLRNNQLDGWRVNFGAGGAGNLCLASRDNKAYISSSNGLTFIDLETKSAMHLFLRGQCEGIFLSDDESLLCLASTTAPFYFFVIDTKTFQVIHKIPLAGLAEGGKGVVIAPDSKMAYVTGQDTSNVLPIDLVTGKTFPPITVGRFPTGIAITSDGATLYVANYISDNVSVVDVATRKVVAKVQLEDECYHLAITPMKLIHNLSGSQLVKQFISSQIAVNYVSWSADVNATTSSYEIRKNGGFLKTISAKEPLEFEDRVPKKGTVTTYQVVAISPTGTRSMPFSIQVP